MDFNDVAEEIWQMLLQGIISAPSDACWILVLTSTAKKGSGMTALMHASKRGHVEVARLLVDAGADENKEN